MWWKVILIVACLLAVAAAAVLRTFRSGLPAAKRGRIFRGCESTRDWLPQAFQSICVTSIKMLVLPKENCRP